MKTKKFYISLIFTLQIVLVSAQEIDKKSNSFDVKTLMNMSSRAIENMGEFYI